MPEYAAHGLIGALTPQANSTVEPELAILWPPGYAILNARITSPSTSLVQRMRDYWPGTDSYLDQFGVAPLSAVAYCCTGVSYIAGKDAEDALVARIETERGYPLITSALAVTDALRVLGATRIGLVSPYPDDLTEASIGYWESRGFVIANCVKAVGDADSFHPIYSLTGNSARDAMTSLLKEPLGAAPLDAIVLLGTGMPTLAPLSERAADIKWDATTSPPVLSCMLCLAWRTKLAADGAAPSANNLAPWLAGEGWTDRLAASLVP
ncbi:MAG: maleate cis-trans isomerase [Alphaproteobacteria bacterium]|jgi:maleate isomerase